MTADSAHYSNPVYDDVLLGVAGNLEIAFAVGMKRSDGFTNATSQSNPYVVTAVGDVLCGIGIIRTRARGASYHPRTSQCTNALKISMAAAWQNHNLPISPLTMSQKLS